MKELPYFLLLIKKNVVLWTIITTGSFANVDLKGIEHDFWTKQYLQINNFDLNDKETFREVWIMTTEISTTISLRPASSKYMDSTKHYFDRDTILDNGNPYNLGDTEVSDVRKKLDTFDVGLNMPLHVTIGKSSVNGYYIDITIYNKGWVDKVNKMKD